MNNPVSLDTICGALAYAMGIDAPENAAQPNQEFTDYIDTVLQGKKIDRLVMFNPDAVAQWVQEKYPKLMTEVVNNTELHLPLCSVMPSVTPVCFGTMYTGAQPAVHGIQAYEKPVIKIDSLFDAMIRAGKKCAIVSNPGCSLNHIFREREMDYFEASSANAVNAIAAKLLLEDTYDFLVIYNGNYDSRMHRTGPEHLEALGELRANVCAYDTFRELIERNYQHHNTLLGFAMDHGCHETEPTELPSGKIRCGTHGQDIPEDMNIVHHYRIYPAEK